MNILGEEYETNSEAMKQSRIGLEKYQIQDYKGSIEAFTNAINSHPQNQNFYTFRGTAYEDMGNDFGAEKDFRKALELNPTNFVAAYRLGMVCFRKKDLANSIKWLVVSHENSPEFNLDHLGLGKNNILHVDRKLIAGNLGNFLTQVKRYDEGLKYLDEAIKIDPNYPNPYMAKGSALVQIGRIGEAIRCFESAKLLGMPKAQKILDMLRDNKSGDDSLAFYEQGIKLQDVGDINGAIQAYDRAIAINTRYSDAFFNRGTAFATLEDYSKAERDFTTCILIDPNYAKAFFNRGAVKLNYDRNEARKDFLKAGQLGIKQAFDIIEQYCD